jgi:hypothetical protein
MAHLTGQARSVMHIVSICEVAGFGALRDDWERLFNHCAEVSVFQTFEWQYTWWKHFGDDRNPYILLAYEQDQLVAILPLCKVLETLPLIRPLRRIRLIGIGGETSPDYLGQIALPEFAARAAHAFCKHLLDNSSEWDVLEVSDLKEGTDLLLELSRVSPPGRSKVAIRESARISYADLPKSWDAYLAAMTSHARYSECATQILSHSGQSDIRVDRSWPPRCRDRPSNSIAQSALAGAGGASRIFHQQVQRLPSGTHASVHGPGLVATLLHAIGG